MKHQKRAQRAQRDTGPGYDLVRYSSGKSFVAPASGRPDFTSKREAVRAAEHANAEWERKGRPTLSQEMGSFFAPASRDRGGKRFRSKRARQAFISKKIRILKREGYPPEQAIAIALRYAGVPKKGKRA
jgi:hypothetical protein